MVKKRNFNLKRLSINLPIDLDNKVKDFALKNGINVTSAYIILINKAINDKKFKDLINNTKN